MTKAQKRNKRNLERKRANKAGTPLTSNREEIIQKVLAKVTPNGRNCHLVAAATSEVLTEYNIPHTIALGQNTLRVGRTDLGLVGYNDTVADITNTGGLNVHLWVETAHELIDLSFANLKETQALIDSMDGQTSDLRWAPGPIWMSKKDLTSLKDVWDGPQNGFKANYKKQRDMTAQSDIDDLLAMAHVAAVPTIAL